MSNDNAARWKRLRGWEPAWGLSDRPAATRKRGRFSVWARLHTMFRVLFERLPGRGFRHLNRHGRNPHLKEHSGVM